MINDCFWASLNVNYPQIDRELFENYLLFGTDDGEKCQNGCKNI